MAIRPVFSLAVPVQVRGALLAHRERLRPESTTLSALAGAGARGDADRRGAVSRLPRWVTVLGLVLVLGELVGAALLAKGPGSLAIGAPGGIQTVVLQVDHVPVQGIPCSPYCSPMTEYTTPTGSGTYTATDDALHALPFRKTVRMRADGTVTLEGSYVGDQSITCSITVNGKVLSRHTNNGSSNAPSAHCQSVIP